MVAGAFPSLDTAVNVAFPAIDEHFSLDIADLQWVVICYLLAYGALLVGAGRLGDAFGYRRLVWWGSIVSVIGLAGCAAAPTFPVFLLARIVQGVGTALVLAGAPALLTTAADGDEPGRLSRRGRAVGLFQTAAMVGLTIGPVAGGPLVEYLGWRSVYWCRIPVALALLVLASGARDRRPARSQSDIDPVETTVGVAAIAGVVAVASLGRVWGWFDVRLAAVALLTLLLTSALVRRNRSAPQPMIDPELWQRPGFLRANLLNAVANAAVFPTWLLVPTLLVDDIGVALVVGGLILAISPAFSSTASLWIARLVDDRDPNPLATAGLAMQAVGMAALAFAGPAGSTALIGLGLAIVGAGLGIFIVPNMHQVMAALPIDRQGVAGGLTLTMRTLGIVIGVAIASAIFDPIEQANGFGAGFRAVFVISAVVLAVATVASANGSRQTMRT